MAFWQDPFVEELEAEEKLLYLYLITCPHTNNLGVLEISRKRISFESGLTLNTVQKGLDRLRDAGKVMIDGNFILLTRFIKNQTTTSPKIVESLRGMLESVPSTTIRHEICLRYPHLFEGCDLPPIPSAKGIDTVPAQCESTGDTVSIPYAEGIDTVSIPSRAREDGSWKMEEESRKLEKGKSVARETRAPARAQEKPSDQKLAFGEYGRVKLFQREYDRLCEKYGQTQTEEAVHFLDLHLASKGKDPYKDHCAALQKWVYDAVARQQAERQKTQAQHVPRASTVAQQRQQERQIQARMLLADREQRRQAEEKNAQGQRYVTNPDGTKLALPPGW